MVTSFPDLNIDINDPDRKKVLHRPGQAFDVVDVKSGADDETGLCLISDGESTVSWKT